MAASSGAASHAASPFRRTAIAAVAALAPLAAIAGCATTPPQCEGPRAVVLAFYREALLEKRVRPAFEHFAAADFVEHKADVPEGTREATVRYLEALVAELPAARWEVVRTIAEGDFVFLHAKFTPAPGAEPYAIADVFRVRDGRIVEHWDIVAAPPQGAVNPHSRF